ncbi:hypothetical protein SY88_01105 [Clostridiales bacterium PH28_bin88]|nr:hypothetical protein SY88_01105 [Clostridiales bacterium PH28_bin88]
MIRIGTAGYSYRDWVGPFYPPGTKGEDMLSYYAKEFPFVELNSSYYRMPNRHMLWNMQAKTPHGFLFAVKAHRSITHQEDTGPGAYEEFREALSPLAAEGKLACVLAQFPHSFRCTEANRSFLRALRDGMGDLPVVVEFRHQSWIREGTMELLRQQQLGFVCVDEPDLKGLVRPVVACTGPVAYVRFHGRNADRWWDHRESFERYNYLYLEEELREWLPRIRVLSSGSKKLFISFNNHYQGQAIRNGRMMRALLTSFGGGSFPKDVE